MTAPFSAEYSGNISPIYVTHLSCSSVATKLATPFRFLPFSEIFQPLHSFHSFRPYTHPTYAALKRLLHLLSFLYVSCRLLTSSHTALFLHDSDNNTLPLPGPVTAASSPTRSRRFTPPGSRTGPGRSRVTWFPPDRVGPTRSTVAHSAQAHSGSVPGTPVRPGPTRITGGSSARADSDPSVQSRHLTSTTAALRTRKPSRPR